jgi:Helix-turn-helix domain
MTAPTTHPQTRLGRFLAAYRGHLSPAEAARRAGVPQARWVQVETGDTPTSQPQRGPRTVPPQTVAAMCAAVGADIATGLELAGHDPGEYQYLVEAPPKLMHLRPSMTPCIAIHRAIVDATGASPHLDPRPQITAIYRAVAATNHALAEHLINEPPDARTDYWRGYADALRAIADEQTRMAAADNPN